MNIFKGIFKRSDSAWKILLDLMRNVGTSQSGVSVSEGSSITLSAVWAALVLISETMSTVPLQVFRRTNEGRDLYRDHPLYTVLHDRANRYETAQKFRERFFWNMEIAGIGLAEIIHNRGGQVAELYNIDPREVTEYFLDQNNNLNVRISGTVLGPDKLFYCYGPGQDGLRPRGRVTVAREAIGLGLAAQEFGGRFFSQGTHSGGFVQTDNKLSDDAFKRLKTSINEKYSGLDKAHQLILLEEGLKFVAAGMSNEDAQFLETRKFQIADIARFFGVKSYMLGDLERATFSNIEQQGIENIAYSWRPRAVRFEQSVSQQLLLPAERRLGIYVEHNLNALKQGDLKSQVDAWHLLIQDGVFNSDEVRAMLNMNFQENGQGKIYFMPANMQDKMAVKEGLPLQENSRAKIDIVPAIRSIQSTGNLRYRQVIEEIRSKHGAFDELKAESLSFSAALEWLFARRYCDFDVLGYREQVVKIIEGQKKRAEQGDLMANDEITRVRNAFHYAAIQNSGCSKVIWRSNSSCPHCKELDGTVVNVGQSFIPEGKIRHAPHKSLCDCDIEGLA